MHNFTIIRLEKTDSTNSHLSALLSEKAVSQDSVVMAKYQKSGKGQGNNKWEGEKGANLLCSILIKPDYVKAQDQFRLSKIISLALIDTLHDLNLKGLIKWPNDIIVNGKKIAGILIENSLLNDSILTSIIGVGLNINQKSFPSFPVTATSVLIEKKNKQDIDKVLNLLLDKFDYWREKLKDSAVDEIDIEYLENLYGLNKVLTFRKGNKEFKAMIAGVGESGRLFLRRDDGKIMKISFREVEFI